MPRVFTKALLFAAASLLSNCNVYAELDDVQVTVTERKTPADDCLVHDKTKVGKYVSVFYTGSIDKSSETGEPEKVFESNIGHEEFSFQIGVGGVILGWDRGLMGKCVGDKITLVIPPHMGYKETGAHGVIPPNATLRFDIEITKVSDTPGPRPNLFAQIDANKDGYLDHEEVEEYFLSVGAEGTPPNLWSREDKDGDEKISWEEFSGPKGEAPPGEAPVEGDEL